MMALLDVIIVGAGPAGVTAAIYAKRKGLSVEIISDSVGGQVSKTGQIENYPGYEQISGLQLTKELKGQIDRLHINVNVSRASKVERVGNLFRITTESGHALESRSVIIASGAHWKEMNVLGEAEYHNRGVSYCTTCDAPLFAGVDVAVVGGANSAAESVIELTHIASKIYMVVRSNLKADQIIVDRIKLSPKVELYEGWTVERVNGGDFVQSIDIVSRSGERKRLNVEGVFVEIGLLPNTSLVKGLVKLNERNEIIIDEECKTSVEGMFACGDATNIPQKQIIIAAGEGAKAAMSAFEYLSRH
ncbi:MAG TPA: FAD-dependent oxidoreductase [Methanocellaceae archaeon]